MLFSVNWLAVIMPLFLAQYILAIFTLTRLALARLPIRCYVVWNIVILRRLGRLSRVLLRAPQTDRRQDHRGRGRKSGRRTNERGKRGRTTEHNGNIRRDRRPNGGRTRRYATIKKTATFGRRFYKFWESCSYMQAANKFFNG